LIRCARPRDSIAQHSMSGVATTPAVTSPSERTHSAQRRRLILVAFASGVDLIAQIAPRHVRRADREFRLSDLRGVHADAAAAAITTGDPVRAVELLEQARGVLLIDELDVRAGSLALRDLAPHLAAEWDAVLEELADESQSTDDRRALSQRWQNVLDRIRAIPDLQAFLRPPSALDLRVTDGAVVLVNVSLLRCDALLITPEGVRAERLRRLTFDEVEDRAGAYLAALDALDGGDLVARFDAQAVVRETLVWLWDTSPARSSRPSAIPAGPACGGARPARSPTYRCTPLAGTTSPARPCWTAWCRPTRPPPAL